MPWLERGEDVEKGDGKLLLVHVPRCGGTSLVKQFKVESKCKSGRSLWNRAGLTYFFYRYRTLETANFPVRTFENLYGVTLILIGLALWFAVPDWGIGACAGDEWCPPPVAISMWVMGLSTMLLSTFVMGAPVMGRRDIVRRALMRIFGTLLCECATSRKYLHGVGNDGFLMHYTAEKMLTHGFVEREDLAASFAIVRNPFSRMFSLYLYNRMGPLESFDHFVREWHAKWKRFAKTGSTEERDTYCHVLPMRCYTHSSAGERLVPSIIRQEDLKFLTKAGADLPVDPSGFYRYDELPPAVLAALRAMPHKNKRKKSAKWTQLYSQASMDLVLEMYAEDFALFGYDTSIPGRADLSPTGPAAPPSAKPREPAVSPHDSTIPVRRGSSCLSASSSVSSASSDAVAHDSGPDLALPPRLSTSA